MTSMLYRCTAVNLSITLSPHSFPLTIASANRNFNSDTLEVVPLYQTLGPDISH